MSCDLIYKEIHPPTGIAFTCSGFITHCSNVSSTPNLVIARSTQLDVFCIRGSVTSALEDAANAAPSSAPAAPASKSTQQLPEAGSSDETGRLELVASYPLNGVVESMAVLRARVPGTQRDAIMLTFRDAKLSVLEWHDASHALRPSSLHSFEGEAALREGRMVFPDPPRVMSDYQGRCAAVAVFNHHLAVLPALEADALELISLQQQQQQQSQLGSAATLGNSYVINLSKQGLGIKEVRDCAFLHGYTEPVLLVLHQPDPAWPGRYRERKDTCALVAISLSLRRKKQTVLWSMAGLPASAARVVPVPDKPAALVLCPSYIMYCSQAGHHQVAVSSLGVPGDPLPHVDFTSSYEPPHVVASKVAKACARGLAPEVAPAIAKQGGGIHKLPGIEVDLSGARHCWLSATCCLLCLASGQQLAVHVRFEGSAENRIQVLPVVGGPVASDVCLLRPGLMFLGSWTGDSLLLRYGAAARSSKAASGEAGGRAAKRQRLEDGSDSVAIKQEDEEEEEEEEEEQEQEADANAPPKLAMRCLDSLPGLGPIRDLLHIDTSSHTPTDPDAFLPRGGPTIFAAIGNDKSGGVAMMRPGLIPDVITEVPLTAVHGMWAIRHRRDELLTGGEEGKAQQEADHHAYLLLSREGATTMVLETGEELQEVTESSNYITDQPTVAAGNLFNMAGIVQVCPRALRVYDGIQPIQDMTVEELLFGAPAGNITIKSAHIEDPYVLLYLSNGLAVLLEGELESMSLMVCIPAHEPLFAHSSSDPLSLITACCLHRDETGWLDAVLTQSKSKPTDPAKGGQGQAGAEPSAADSAAAGADPAAEDGEAPGSETKPELVAIKPEPMDTDQGAPAGHAAEASAPGGESADAAAVGDKPPEAADAGAGWAPEQHQGQGGDDGNNDGSNDGAKDPINNDPFNDDPFDDPFGCCAAPPAGPSASIYVCLVRRNGVLQMYRLPDMELAFEGQAFGTGPQLLTHASAGAAAAGLPAEHRQQHHQQQQAMLDNPAGRVLELRMESFKGASTSGVPDCERPVLLALTANGNLLAYQAFERPAAAAAAGSSAATAGADARAGQDGSSAKEAEADGVGQVQGGPSKAEADADAASGPPHAMAVDGGAAADQKQQLTENADDAMALALVDGRSGEEQQQQQQQGGGDRLTHGQRSAAGRLAFQRLPLQWASYQGAASTQGAASASRMVRFDAVAYNNPEDGSPGPHQSGVFVCGARPVWLVASRGGLVMHPMHIDGPITAMTPFHNVNCPYGFIASATSGQIKVCNLPCKARLDTPWVTLRVPQRATVHRMAHCREVNMLAVAVSRPMPFRQRLPEEAGGDPHASAAYAVAEASAQALGREEGHEVRLLELPHLTPVPGVRPLLQGPGEWITALRMVYLRDSATGNVVPMLAVGTSMPMGEDYPCLGRIIVYKLEKGVRDRGGGNMDTTWQVTQLFSREFMGPVSSAQDFKGFLLLTVGRSVEMHAWNGRALVKHAFYDAPLLVTSINVVKDYLLVGDVHKGASFVRYVESSKVLELLSRDFENHDVVSSGIVINGKQIGFIVADASGTVRQFEFDKRHPASWAGQRLISGGALHTGHLASRMHSIKMAAADGTNRHMLLAAGHDGSFGMLCPLWDGASALRLGALQKLLGNALSHPAGLNPRAFRRRHLKTPKALGGGQHHSQQADIQSGLVTAALLAKQQGQQQPAAPAAVAGGAAVTTGHVILDGDLLWRFALLPRGVQQQLAAAMGAAASAGADHVLSDLSALTLAATL